MTGSKNHPRGMVGRTPWSAADAPVGLLALCMVLISLARQRDEGVPRGPGGPPHHLPSQRRRSVFHGISRAEGPFKQGRKTNLGSRSGKPGTDGTASEFPAKGAGNPWQSRQSPEGTVAGGAVFHEVSRAERPSQQATKGDGLSYDSTRWIVGALLFQLAVGIYGGYFGAGIGILMLAALSILGLHDIHEMNSLKVVFGGTINGVAAAYFIWARMVYWPDVLIMAVGAILGGIGGAGTARKIGRTAVRRIVIAIGFGMAVSLFIKK